MVSLNDLKENYVLTPHGARHKKCLLEIEDGAQSHLSPTPCVHRPPNLRALRPRGPAGWLETATFTPSQPLRSMSVTFQVPEPPCIRDQSLVYLFPGAQDASMTTILQPVLQWGNNNLFPFENQWVVACWVADTYGRTYHSKFPLRVNTGDTITGNIFVVPGSRTADTCDWTVQAIVNGGEASKQLTVTGMKRLLLFLAAGALEAYSLETQEPLNGTEARLLPETGSTTFDNISLVDLNGAGFVADWNSRIIAAGCGYHIDVSPDRKSVTLEYP